MQIPWKKAKKLAKFFMVVLFVFIIGGIGGVYFNQHVLPAIRANKWLSRINFLEKTAENVTVINRTEQVTIKEDDSVSEVASQASNAVVNIVSIQNQKDPVTKKAMNVSESGTGVVVTSDGLIATYRSSIYESGATYQVFLYDGSRYTAALQGIDNYTNLAFLKIDAPNLSAISIGDSSLVDPGRKLIAIGNSFGEYQNRYAAGLLSNIDKTFNLSGQTVASTEKLEGVLETDFLNQDSYIGGPVIDYNGDMVGMVGKMSINNVDTYFEIPSNVIKHSIGLAVNASLDQQPFFGAYYLSITKEYALANNLDVDRGALIYAPSGKQGLAIMAGSPAESSGLKIGDIVTMVGDQEISLDNPLSNLLEQYKKGDTIGLTVERSGQQLKIQVQL
jgi:S1-C subfamily serine protease